MVVYLPLEIRCVDLVESRGCNTVRRSMVRRSVYGANWAEVNHIVQFSWAEMVLTWKVGYTKP